LLRLVIRNTIMRSNKILAVVSLLALLLASCGSTSRYNAINIPCSRTPDEITRAAREYLLTKGFNQRTYRPDSGYYRTALMKVETVSEKISHAPLWYVVEVRCRENSVDVAGYSLLYGRNSEARQYGTSPEDERQTEEEGIIPGTRAYSAIVVPLVDHLKEFCREK
jgi:hypothetical protein